MIIINFLKLQFKVFSFTSSTAIRSVSFNQCRNQDFVTGRGAKASKMIRTPNFEA